MGRKVCVALVDSEVIGQQSVPKGARLVREAEVMMARDRARKASQTEAKPTKAKEKAKVASDKHERYLKGTAITVGKGFFHAGKNPGNGGKGKSAGSLNEPEASGLESTSVGFGLCLFANQCDYWK